MRFLFLSLAFILFSGGRSRASELSNEQASTIIRGWEEALAQDPRFTRLNEDEAAMAVLQEQLLEPWSRSFRDRSSSAFSALLSEKVSFPRWGGSWKVRREREGIRESAAKNWGSVRGREKAVEQVQSYLAGFSLVEHVSLEAVRIERMNSTRARLRLRYDLRGVEASGRLRTDRGELSLEAVENGGAWKIAGLETAALESLSSTRAAFEDRTSQSGLAGVPVWPRLEAIRRGGYGTAVGDFDGDGDPDLYLGAWGPGGLYRNDGKGNFAPLPAGGRGEDRMVKSAAFADLDNDGRQDLVLVRFVEDKEDDLRLYRGMGGGRFESLPSPVTRAAPYDRGMPMAMGDFNRDGLLDLWVGFPGTRDFTTMNPGYPTVTPQGLFRNQGGAHFSDVTVEANLGAVCRLYPHSATTADLDLDGHLDLLVVDDRANLSPIYRNRGDGRFHQEADRMGSANWGWGMSAAVGDYDGDGRPDLYFTNIGFTAAQRILNSTPREKASPAEKVILDLLRNMVPGNRLLRSRKALPFEETTAAAGLGWAGEGAGGAEWFDYNNDGWLDLYVANGVWTPSGDSQDISSLFLRRYLQKTIEGTSSAVSAAAVEPSLMSVLQAYRGAGGRKLALAGGQRNRLYRNNGDGSFTEVGFVTGTDAAEDGYMAAVADVDQDGLQDLVLRNGDPPEAGMPMPTVRLLRNASENRSRSLIVSLEGTRSNRDAVGARLTAWVGGRRMTREIKALSGTVQSERAAHFGLGVAGQVDRLDISWPSGLVETYSGLSAGRRVLKEGGGSELAHLTPGR